LNLHLHSTMSLFQLFFLLLLVTVSLYLHSTMSLFQLIDADELKRRLKRFTFHYVPISTGIFPALVAVKKHLHSTMSLFQLQKNTGERSGRKNLHSTMSLFQPCFFVFPDLLYTKFTFHYVPISTKLLRDIRKEYKDLHSTMSLFQRRPALLNARLLRIYIPLCPYFNCGTSGKYKHPACIYIPLCPYFNCTLSGFFSLRKNIYIPLCPYFNKDNTKADRTTAQTFTFHYVPISTDAEAAGEAYKYDLHSTMSLFQHFCGMGVTSRGMKFTFHYVPISTFVTDNKIYLSISFTFHYVPISTRPTTPRTISLIMHLILSSGLFITIFTIPRTCNNMIEPVQMRQKSTFVDSP